MITWGPGSTFAAPLSNFQVNCESGAADIGVNNAGSQENSTTTNVRTQDCPVANFQLSNTDGSINNHVQNIYMTNLNSLYINAVCAAGTRAFYSNTSGSGLYIDKATTVLGNSNVGTGCPNGGTAPTTVDEVNGPILAIDWHIEANAIGFPSMSGVNGISVGLTNAGNSHNDTFISTKFATANGGCGFKIFSAVTSFVAINTDISGTAGAGLHWSDSFCDSASGNTLTFANNPQVGLYALDSAGALFSNANTADSNLTGIFVYNNVISGWNGGTKNFSANALTGFLQANIYNPGLLYSAAGTPVPTCNSSSNGEQVTVSDLTTVAFNGAYVTGGSNTWPLVCSFNGSTYAWKVY